MAKGRSIIRAPLLGADCISTINVFRALGVKIDLVDGREAYLQVESQGKDSWQSPKQELDFGNSGTTARLLIGLFAGIPGLKVRCIGDASLSKRPMRRVVDLLRQMGAQISGEEDANFLPITIEGRKLRPARHQFNKASAQVKSAVMLAGLNTPGETVITLPRGGRDHTEKFLKFLGADVKITFAGSEETLTVRGDFTCPAIDVTIPADPSSAAFFASIACLLPKGSVVELHDVLDNPTRTGFIKVLQDMGAEISTELARGKQKFMEPVLNLRIRSGKDLRSVQISADAVATLVDEVPILSVLAGFASGASRFCGLHELRVKESDRLTATATLVKNMSLKAEITGDDLSIVGKGRAHAYSGFEYDALGDHRLAMSAAIAAKFARSDSKISNYDCVDVSFPGFYQILDSVCEYFAASH